MKQPQRRRRRIELRAEAFAGFFFATIGLILLWCYRGRIKLSDDELYWVAVFSGNWSADGQKAVQPFWFLIGIIIAILLNILTIIGIVTAAYKLFTFRDALQMNILNALTLKEATIKDEVLASLSDAEFDRLKPRIEEAFRKGGEVWERNVLPSVLGRNGAKRLLDQLVRNLSLD